MEQFRLYNLKDVISFHKTNEEYGILSNMKGRLCLYIDDISIYSSESLYQAFRFTNDPIIQKYILQERSPLIAKRIAYKYKDKTRNDWDLIKINIMRLCLRIKYIQCGIFREVLNKTNTKPIVEISRKDKYWGTVPISDQEVEGLNVLGRLLMELRNEDKNTRCIERINHILTKCENINILSKKIEVHMIV
jgi:ribA/ribD-fused uncharacterized protein